MGTSRIVAAVSDVFLVVGDQIVRRSLHELVQSDDDLEVIGQAAGVTQALGKIPPCRPDVALVDDRLPDGNGFDLCRDLRSRLPDLQCLILTSFSSSNFLLNTIRAGASGCIVRNAKGVEILTAIKGAAAGEYFLDTAIATSWLAGRARKGSFVDGAPVLTDLEGQLLRLLASGNTGNEVITRMRLDEKAFRASLWTLIAKAQTPGDDGWAMW